MALDTISIHQDLACQVMAAAAVAVLAGLRWRDAPREYGPHKTLYNRWKRWSDKGVFARIMTGLAARHGEKKTVIIDETYLKADRTATSMGVKKGGADV